nr:uncharacterized protein LOC111424343 [Onthophagus taurus]
MKLALLAIALLFVVVAESNKKHVVHHKKYHLKRDSSGNNTDGVPSVYEPIVPVINQVNTDKQEVNPISAVISWFTKKSYDGSRKHHLNRNGNTSTTISTTPSTTTSTTISTNTTGQYNSTSSWFFGNFTTPSSTNSSSTQF